MNKSAWIGGLVLLAVVIIGVVIWANRAEAPVAEEDNVTAQGSSATSPTSTAATFQPQTFTQIKSAHFVSSEPANNAVLTSALQSVRINFNFDLAPPSAISVTRDGTDVTTGSATIAPDKLSMSVPIEATKSGNYLVNYDGCWPDGSCHKGSFGFSVNLTP